MKALPWFRGPDSKLKKGNRQCKKAAKKTLGVGLSHKGKISVHDAWTSDLHMFKENKGSNKVSNS